MLEKPKLHSHQFELSSFKTSQFKISNFFVTSVLPFCQYCDRRLTFGKVAYILLETQLIYSSNTLLCLKNDSAAKHLLRIKNMQ